MAVWVQLRSAKYIEIKGEMQEFLPGDWVQIGKQTAQRWITAGDAVSPSKQMSSLLPGGSGVAARGSSKQGNVWKMGFQIVPFSGCLPFPKTLVWDTSLNLRNGLIFAGFKLLEKWQVAVPLWSYDKLVCHVLDEEEDRGMTARVIRDLRVPMYDQRMVFMRRCKDTQKLLALWHAEREKGDDRLAFLRALYTVKPTICALPVSWSHRKGEKH